MPNTREVHMHKIAAIGSVDRITAEQNQSVVQHDISILARAHRTVADSLFR